MDFHERRTAWGNCCQLQWIHPCVLHCNINTSTGSLRIMPGMKVIINTLALAFISHSQQRYCELYSEIEGQRSPPTNCSWGWKCSCRDHAERYSKHIWASAVGYHEPQAACHIMAISHLMKSIEMWQTQPLPTGIHKIVQKSGILICNRNLRKRTYPRNPRNEQKQPCLRNPHNGNVRRQLLP